MKSQSISTLYKGTVLLLFCCIVANSMAQKRHFIYLQSDAKQPFYVQVNNKHFSSNLTGTLILPRLKSGRYFFVAGFPKNQFPEQKFTLVVTDKDLGFYLKKADSSNWYLTNIVNASIVKANEKGWDEDKAAYDTTKIEDDYSVITNPIKPATTNTTTTPKDTAQTTAKVETTSTETAKKGIVRTYQKGGSAGFDEVYVDYTVNPTDTITIFIPVLPETVNKDATVVTEPVKTTAEKPSVANGKQAYNSKCVLLAIEADFNKVRKAMSYESADDKMILVGRKLMGNTCFYVEQVKKLGLLFISEQSRLKFFNTVKSQVYDLYNYPSLEAEFTLSLLISQFRESL